MSGIIAVYSLVIAVLIAEDMGPPSEGSYSLFKYARARFLSLSPSRPTTSTSHDLPRRVG